LRLRSVVRTLAREGAEPPFTNPCIAQNDRPQWRDRTAADFSRMRRKVVDGRRILEREKRAAVALIVFGG